MSQYSKTLKDETITRLNILVGKSQVAEIQHRHYQVGRKTVERLLQYNLVKAH